MPDLPDMALSIRQPWAWAILNAGKDIENRNWHTSFRGPVCIHASKGMTKREFDEFEGLYALDSSVPEIPEPGDLPRGGIVGVAEIVDCVNRSDSPWFFGRWGFVLRNVRPVPFLPCRGALGFFGWRNLRCDDVPKPARWMSPKNTGGNMTNTIAQQVYEALNAATHENGYPHEYERPARDIVTEINDWSGIEGFDPENLDHLNTGCGAVATWRANNPQSIQPGDQNG